MRFTTKVNFHRGQKEWASVATGFDAGTKRGLMSALLTSRGAQNVPADVSRVDSKR
jgi:hypothetical protein